MKKVKREGTGDRTLRRWTGKQESSRQGDKEDEEERDRKEVGRQRPLRRWTGTDERR